MYDNFEKYLIETVENVAAVSPTKNIGEAAISEVMNRKEKKTMINNNKFPLKVIAIAACLAVFAFGGVMAASADVRSSVVGFVQSIFIIEKQGDSYVVAEKGLQEADQQQVQENKLDADNYIGIPVSEFSKDELTAKLGFEPFIPQKIDTGFKIIDQFSLVGVNLTGKTSDLLALDKAEVMQSIKDDAKLENFKQYSPSRYINAYFSANGDAHDEIWFTLNEYKNVSSNRESATEEISDFDYKGIKCTYMDIIMPNYQNVTGNSGTYNDITKQPDGVVHNKRIVFGIDGIHYSVSYVKNYNISEFDYDAVKQFVEDFIDAYLNK